MNEALLAELAKFAIFQGITYLRMANKTDEEIKTFIDEQRQQGIINNPANLEDV